MKKVLRDKQQSSPTGSDRGTKTSSSTINSDGTATITAANRNTFFSCQRWQEEYRSSQYYHHAVIGVSANSDSETANEAIAAGFDAFLPKPFAMDIFHTTVLKVLAKIQEDYESHKYPLEK